MKAPMIVLLALIAVSFSAGAQEDAGSESFEIIDAYEFPIRPGMPEWRDLKSHKEMLDVCQIPEDILADMSTEGLVQTCLNYPLLREMEVFRNYQVGIEKVISRFNGLQKLMERKDAGTLLIKVYADMNPENLPKGWTIMQRGGFKFQFKFIEMLLGQDAMLANLSKNERDTLLHFCLIKTKPKVEMETYGITYLETAGCLMGRILHREGVESFNKKLSENKHIEILLREARLCSVDTFNEIVFSAHQYLVESGWGETK